MQVKYTYPYKVSQLTSCFQVVTHSHPSNNVMTDMGKLGIQLDVPLPASKLMYSTKVKWNACLTSAKYRMNFVLW